MVWEGYTDTLFTKPFEEACGVKVNATYMGSSDDLVAKLRAGGAETIDLISPSSDAATAIIEAGLAPPIDLARVPSYERPERGLPQAQGGPKGHCGLRHSVGVRPQPVDLRHDEGEAQRRTRGGRSGTRSTAGKLSLQDDIATLYMVAQYLGMDDPANPSKLYNLSDEELAKVKAKMLELRPNVRKYWVTAGDMTQLFQSGEVVMGEGWPLMTNQLRQAKFPAGETIPKEGTTAWADHWVLTKGAKNLDAAYAWLEYTAQPFTQKLLYDVTAYIVANPSAKSYMTPEQAATSATSPTTGPRSTSGSGARAGSSYQEIWNEVKAGR